METSPSQEPFAVIRMEDVTIGSMTDPGVVVAEHVNWTVHTGDFWVIAGLQGAGKSDFLMMTGGVMAPLAGRYRLFEEEMPIFEDARLKERLRLGLVFDGGRLLNHLTVVENVALPLRYHRNLSAADALREVTQLLDAMELGTWAHSTPGAIGRNWHKRVGLARALVLKPEVLLVDNPLGGLDLPHTNWWLSFLHQLAQGHPLLDGRPLTLVVTTANLRLWQGRARQFAVLRNQRLVVLGNWPQVESAQQELLQELMPLERSG
jgi:ABC-type transporter Mla maintaining outer membrane lipid asymmetry ATPase subunit MlaF